MAGVIDADTHIAEPEAMWKFFDEDMHPRRPVLTSITDDTLYGIRNKFWLIDGNIFPKPSGKGGFRLVTPASSTLETERNDSLVASREITDVGVRLADMDRLGVETQVIYPTLFLVYLTEDVDLDIALAKAYNRYMWEVEEKAGGRMRWTAVLPLRSIDASIDEMRLAKEHGAVGIFFRGMEGERTLDDPYFFPVYEEANSLELPICIHTGSGCPTLTNMFNLERNHTFHHGRVLPIFAFRDIIHNRIPEMFPKLRFGFIEASAGWVPFLLHILRRLLKQQFKFDSSAELFQKYRLFVACEADEDIPYLIRYMGEDNIVIGSDYGHNDPSFEPELAQTIRSREDLSPAIADKILYENPKQLYNL